MSDQEPKFPVIKTPTKEGNLYIYPLSTKEANVTLPSGEKAKAEIYETSDPHVFVRQITREGVNQPERDLIRLSIEETRKFRRKLVGEPGRDRFLQEISELKPLETLK